MEKGNERREEKRERERENEREYKTGLELLSKRHIIKQANKKDRYYLSF